MFNAQHFYVIFNPNLPSGPNNKHFNISQAHEFYKELSQRVNSQDQNPYMYWGKIGRSTKNPKDVFNIFEAKKIIDKNKENGLNTHLYISDFNYFWVAKIEDVSKGNDQEFFKNSLEFYTFEKEKGCEIEAWFKVTDMTLVSRNHKETHQFIGGLYTLNQFKNKRSLDPYISGLIYPLTVLDDLHDETLFDTSELLVKTKLREDEPFYEKVHTTINKYCIDQSAFKLLSPTVQDLIIRSEMDFYDDRFNNLESMYLNYYKAIEVQLNEIVLRHLKENWGHEDIIINYSEKGASTFQTPNFCQLRGRQVHLKEFHKGFSLSHLINVVFSDSHGDRICSKHSNNHLFREISGFYTTVTRDLKPFLEGRDDINTRNDIIHEKLSKLTLESFKDFRSRLLGIGQESILTQMAQEARNKTLTSKKKSA